MLLPLAGWLGWAVINADSNRRGRRPVLDSASVHDACSQGGPARWGKRSWLSSSFGVVLVRAAGLGLPSTGRREWERRARYCGCGRRRKSCCLPESDLGSTLLRCLEAAAGDGIPAIGGSYSRGLVGRFVVVSCFCMCFDFASSCLFSCLPLGARGGGGKRWNGHCTKTGNCGVRKKPGGGQGLALAGSV